MINEMRALLQSLLKNKGIGLPPGDDDDTGEDDDQTLQPRSNFTTKSPSDVEAMSNTQKSSFHFRWAFFSI
ncbi:hypothetical protein K1719_026932 [Acacia pycnantha]|nr:hypothetical protein K1719_026932 [Acacia pycnantha]